MKANLKSIILLVVILVVIILAVSWFTNAFKDEEKFEYSDLIELFEHDLVTSFNVDGELAIKLTAYKPIRDEKGKIIGHDTTVTEDHTYELSYNFQLQQINDIALENYRSASSNLTPAKFAVICNVIPGLTSVSPLVIANVCKISK